MATASEPSDQPVRRASPRPAGTGRRFPSLLHAGRILKAPPIWRETRVAGEYASLVRDPVFAGRDIPRGDGRPVMLIPGFLAGDASMNVMSAWLKRIGYYAEQPGISFNINYSEVLLKSLATRLVDLYGWRARRVTLLGHSRGGILAKVLAHRQPEMVEQVICLGSPLVNPFDVHPVTMAGVRMAQVFNFVRYGKTSGVEARFMRDLEAAPRVPTTSIYSRTDGIVNWEACVRDDVRSIAVRGSHMGLVLNPEVYAIVARLLTEPARRR